MQGGSRGVRIRGVGDGGREVDAKALSCAGAFDLALSERKAGVLGIGGHTSHRRLNVSKSTKERATVSSLRLDLYCFSKRAHISVYSPSGMESLM